MPIVERPAATSPNSPWKMQESGTTAGLRGIYSVDGKVVWASGTGGTVLRTVDGGEHWTKCAVPDGAADGATLDFRGVQAWDAQTAIIMASGPGDKSRLYKTSDGCKTWSLLLKNARKDGFWDAIVHPLKTYGDAKAPGDYTLLAGDPIDGRYDTRDGFPLIRATEWETTLSTCKVEEEQALFAASNSSVVVSAFESFILATGGKGGARVIFSPLQQHDHKQPCKSVTLPMAGGTDSSGIFSIDFRDKTVPWVGIAAGGDYTKPNESAGTAAWTADGGLHWTAAIKPPHGYRSSVAWSEDLKAWITVGTNGSDISRDDGKTWEPLDDGNWNALSLPFVVGPKGRIARLSIASIK